MDEWFEGQVFESGGGIIAVDLTAKTIFPTATTVEGSISFLVWRAGEIIPT